MYTTRLFTLLIFSLSLSHHLYADDTQLFFCFHPRNFDSSIAHLQTALQQISSWMSANLLTLNSSKTEFLIIGLKHQLSKIDNSSLNTTHSARNLGFIFDEHLTFSDQISSLWMMMRLLAYGELATKTSTRTCPLYLSEQAGRHEQTQRGSGSTSVHDSRRQEATRKQRRTMTSKPAQATSSTAQILSDKALNMNK